MEKFHKLIITIAHRQSNSLVKFTLPCINIVTYGTLFLGRMQKKLVEFSKKKKKKFHLNVKKDMLDLDLD
jgi:hypothetical protein